MDYGRSLVNMSHPRVPDLVLGMLSKNLVVHIIKLS